MLKALTGLAVGAAAALAISSPAAAAPVCHDDTVYASYYGTFGSYSLDSWNFCDGAYYIVSVNWSLGPSWVYSVGPASAYLDGVYYAPETAVVTVTDGTDTAEFTLTVR